MEPDTDKYISHHGLRLDQLAHAAKLQDHHYMLNNVCISDFAVSEACVLVFANHSYSHGVVHAVVYLMDMA